MISEHQKKFRRIEKRDLYKQLGGNFSEDTQIKDYGGSIQ